MSSSIQPSGSDSRPTPREYAEFLWLEGLLSLSQGVSQKHKIKSPDVADDAGRGEESKIKDSNSPEHQSGEGGSPSQLSDPSQSPSSEERVSGDRTPLFFRETSPLANPLSHQRALHRLIPPREKSWDQQIDLADVIEVLLKGTAFPGGDTVGDL